MLIVLLSTTNIFLLSGVTNMILIEFKDAFDTFYKS